MNTVIREVPPVAMDIGEKALLIWAGWVVVSAFTVFKEEGAIARIRRKRMAMGKERMTERLRYIRFFIVNSLEERDAPDVKWIN